MILKNIVLTLVAPLFLFGCAKVDDANVASHNLSKAADNFEIPRRTVFYNGITDKYILSVEGLCSVQVDGTDQQLELTCKTGDGVYKKHFLGLSDNVTYFSEQLDAKAVSVYHYRVTFKPQTILSDVDFKGSTTDVPKPQ